MANWYGKYNYLHSPLVSESDVILIVTSFKQKFPYQITAISSLLNVDKNLNMIVSLIKLLITIVWYCGQSCQWWTVGMRIFLRIGLWCLLMLDTVLDHQWIHSRLLYTLVIMYQTKYCSEIQLIIDIVFLPELYSWLICVEILYQKAIPFQS